MSTSYITALDVDGLDFLCSFKPWKTSRTSRADEDVHQVSFSSVYLKDLRSVSISSNFNFTIHSTKVA